MMKLIFKESGGLTLCFFSVYSSMGEKATIEKEVVVEEKALNSKRSKVVDNLLVK